MEPLSPQLSDFFGVPENRGVLVRSVDKASPGALAGLKAGDVIVKVNNEIIHDVADWRRALRGQNGKVALGIVRDKKEQVLTISLAAAAGDGDAARDRDMSAAKMTPEQIAEAHRLAREWESKSASR